MATTKRKMNKTRGQGRSLLGQAELLSAGEKREGKKKPITTSEAASYIRGVNKSSDAHSARGRAGAAARKIAKKKGTTANKIYSKKGK